MVNDRRYTGYVTTGFKAMDIYVDRGYRGHNYTVEAFEHVTDKVARSFKASVRKWIKQKTRIEAVI
jgi:hypothetical protein